jgi:hypothetical protein
MQAQNLLPVLALEAIRQGSHWAQHTLSSQTCSVPPLEFCERIVKKFEPCEECEPCPPQKPAPECVASDPNPAYVCAAGAGGAGLVLTVGWLAGFRRVTNGRGRQGRGRYVQG